MNAQLCVYIVGGAKNEDFHICPLQLLYTVNHKKRDILFSIITLANLN